MAYRVAFTPRASAELADLPRHVRRRIARWMDLLAEDPRRVGTKQLTGQPDLRRVHAGRDYVIVYTVRPDELLVLIVRVGHRGDIYRGL